MKKSKMMFKLFVSFLLSESINKLLPSAKIVTTLETLASVLVVIIYTSKSGYIDFYYKLRVRTTR